MKLLRIGDYFRNLETLERARFSIVERHGEQCAMMVLTWRSGSHEHEITIFGNQALEIRDYLLQQTVPHADWEP